MARIALGWNHPYGSFIGELLPDFGAAVSFVGKDGAWRCFPVQKDIHHLTIVHMSTRDCEAQRPALGIYSRMNLGGATAA